MRTYSEPQSMIPCSECNIGQMHKTTVTYFTWLHGELITVPDFPAWVCDICGKREYDHEAVNQINILFNPMSERWKTHKRTSEKTEQPHSKPHLSQTE